MNEIKINNSNGTLTVSSLQIADDFGKQHKHIIKNIENLLGETSDEKSSNLTAQISVIKNFFIESTYADSYGRPQKCYDITRDGFSLLVMGFTGKKALEWKIKYIEAFNAMEEQLKSKLDYSGLSPQLQYLISLEQKTKELETAVHNTNKKLDSVCDTMQVTTDNWRKKTHMFINKLATARGMEQRLIYLDIYDELENRAGVNLTRRYDNLIDRLYKRGASNSVINRMNYIDVIAEDKKLIEIYTSIVKEWCIRYGAI